MTPLSSVNRATDSPAPRSFRVLVAMDFTPESERALRRAMQIANAAPKAELQAVAVIEPTPGRWGHELAGDVPARLGELTTEAFRALAASESIRGLERVTSRVCTGTPAEEITRLAREMQADLVVVGAHVRSALARWYGGSVAQDVVRRAGCPVLVHRERTRRPGAPPAAKPTPPTRAARK